MDEYETDPEEYTLEKTITFFSIGEYTHCSKALSRYVAEQLKRIAELEAVITQVRSNMNKRAVDGFDYAGGEYPINGDTINMLVLDIAERDKRIAEVEAIASAARRLVEDGYCNDNNTQQALEAVLENNDYTQCSSNDLLENNDD